MTRRHSPIAADPAALADALVALNAAPMSRASVCRLAFEAAAWVDAPAAHDARLAASIGVPAAALDAARAALRTAPAFAAAERTAAAALAARIVTHLDADYPPSLRHLPLPPSVLYVRGEMPGTLVSGVGPSVAIVGSRHPSHYGREAGWLFARDLARAGVTVVSGFARGVDAAAHRGALAGGGPTVAVLGCGVDVAYPREHYPRSGRPGKPGGLAGEVAAQGALLSELPLGSPPLKAHFPIRNRLIAALTQATLVVEAAVRSGSLITARCALELGREVLALPGRVFDDNAMGPNALLADGARPALHPRDVLAALSIDAPAAADGSADAPPPLPGLGARLWDALPLAAALGADELASRCAAPIDAVLAELLELELAGWIARLPGPLYCRRG